MWQLCLWPCDIGMRKRELDKPSTRNLHLQRTDFCFFCFQRGDKQLQNPSKRCKYHFYIWVINFLCATSCWLEYWICIWCAYLCLSVYDYEYAFCLQWGKWHEVLLIRKDSCHSFMPEDLKKGDWGKNSLHQLWNNVVGDVGTNFYLGLLAKTAYHLNTSEVFFFS